MVRASMRALGRAGVMRARVHTQSERVCMCVRVQTSMHARARYRALFVFVRRPCTMPEACVTRRDAFRQEEEEEEESLFKADAVNEEEEEEGLSKLTEA